MNKNLLCVKVAIILAAFMFIMPDAKAQKDWARFSVYEKNNEEVIQSQKNGAKKPKAVFMGDSITEGWYRNDKEFFDDNSFIGRGISGQTSCEMLVRFRRDVIELNPKYVLILAGTNDMAQNMGAISIENVYRNIVSMCELAKVHKIKPVICSVLPASYFPWRKELGDRSQDIIALNKMLKDYANKHHYKYIDFHSAMKDEQNGLIKEYGRNGDAVHPNLEGYKVMEKLVLDNIK